MAKLILVETTLVEERDVDIFVSSWTRNRTLGLLEKKIHLTLQQCLGFCTQSVALAYITGLALKPAFCVAWWAPYRRSPGLSRSAVHVKKKLRAPALGRKKYAFCRTISCPHICDVRKSTLLKKLISHTKHIWRTLRISKCVCLTWTSLWYLKTFWKLLPVKVWKCYFKKSCDDIVNCQYAIRRMKEGERKMKRLRQRIKKKIIMLHPNPKPHAWCSDFQKPSCCYKHDFYQSWRITKCLANLGGYLMCAVSSANTSKTQLPKSK